MEPLPNLPLPPAPGAPAPAGLPMGAAPPRPAPANIGPITTMSANSGNRVAAHAAIKNAAEALQKALLQLPMGSDEHSELFGIVKKLTDMVKDSEPDPAAQMQNLVAMAREAAQRGAPPGLNAMMPAPAPATPPALPQAA